MFKVVFEKSVEKQFLKLEKNIQNQIALKIIELKKGNFHNDKALKGNYKGKFRKRAGNYRIIYVKEDDVLIITLLRIAHRKEVY